LEEDCSGAEGERANVKAGKKIARPTPGPKFFR
jgi:hypothetical protein